MAAFKVGQRVRVIGARVAHENIGREGTILSLSHPARPSDYEVEIYGASPPRQRECGWAVLPSHVAPLTDPGCERFLESIRRLKPLLEPA